MKQRGKELAEGMASYADIRERIIRRDNEIVTRLADLSVDVVLPVYNDPENLRNLLPCINKTKLDHRLIIVDDASTDPETLQLLEEYVKDNPQTRVIRNERNLGQVAATNRGLVVTRSPQVALIATDLILPEEWLERLVMPLIKDPTVASCTPFSNNGNFSAFPRPMAENKIFQDRSVEEIDAVFREVRSLYTTIPAASDSCMALNRQVIHEIGVFDQNTFPKGHGEEVDWCIRAEKAGYRNVIVENLYVYHHRRETFRDVAYYKMVRRYEQEIQKKYPDFEQSVREFLTTDPLASVKAYVFMRLTAPKVKRRTLIITNDQGHGGEAYIQDQIAERSVRSEVTFLCRYISGLKNYRIEYRYEEELFLIAASSFDEVMDLCSRMNINAIIVNQMSGYPELKEHLQKIKKLAEDTGATLVDIVHDYLAICPRVRLLNAWGSTCSVPENMECNKCIQDSLSLSAEEKVPVEEWRRMWRDFLLACQEVRVFSQNSLQLMQRAYPDVDRLHVMPERHTLLDSIKRDYSEDDTIGIGILGDLTELKGAKLVKQMVERADKEKLPIRFELLGKCEERIRSSRFHISPLCSEEEFPAAILGLGIDAILIGSIYPEPFSYTTQQAMEMDLPVICLPIGAPVERINRYAKGLILPDQKPQDHLTKIIDFIKGHRSKTTPYTKKVLLVESISVTPLEHFRTVQLTEQLVQQGIVVTVLPETKVTKAKVKQHDILILMEVLWDRKIKKILDEAGRYGIRVWYQLDTVSYDPHYINGYESFVDKEKEAAEEYSTALYTVMERADGILVPTETMSGVIKRDFPGKSVRIWSGRATYPMRALSRKERLRPRPETDRVVLGFIASRHYGGFEFYRITPTIIELLKENPKVHVRIIGEMELSNEFKNYSEQIEQIYCKTWQDYLRAFSGVDIHLMPLSDTLASRNLVGISFLMASLLGIPTVATDTKEIRHMVYSMQDGILCQNLTDLWKALVLLSEDPSLRKKMGENAYVRIVRERTTEQTDNDFLSIFQ